jgi:hypothetical protein
LRILLHEAYKAQLSKTEIHSFVNTQSQLLEEKQSLLKIDDIDKYLFLRNEKQFIAEETVKVLRESEIDSNILQFMVSLFFGRVGENMIDSFCMPGIVQIAKGLSQITK